MKIECNDDKRVSGKRFYTARPAFEISATPYPDNHVRTTWVEMEKWCSENLGESRIDWDRYDVTSWPNPTDRWFANDSSFWFRDEDDRMLFVLRFS